ncbi:MAG: outer membrane beta-barrel protein [Chitinophagaceae bacterium]|nr:outer membrane beta-barrel protein [Chitinophagaceae bacterium]
MKTRLFILFIIFGLGFGIHPLQAQEHSVRLNLGYNYSFPLGTMKSDLISHSSPRGFAGSIGYNLTPQWAVGAEFGFQDYYQKYPRQVYNTNKAQQISGVMSNSVQVIPIMARVEYSPLLAENSKIRPYASLAAGINMVDFNQYLGMFKNQGRTSVNFGFHTGLGLRAIPGKTDKWGIDVGGDYSYAPYNKLGVKNLDNVNVHAGIFIRLQ